MRKKELYRLVCMLLLIFILSSATGCGFWRIPFDAGVGHPPKTPPWALECWLWEDDVNTAERVWELLDGYKEHDIPVRTILIDSPWSTRYNDFVFDEEKYPDPEGFIRELKARGYRVVLWMTTMVNSENRDTAIRDSRDWYEEARDKGYLVGNGYQWKWWKGRGGFIDYTNPEAMEWWRGMQQPLFDWGIDGWKLDGTASFFSSRLFGIVPIPIQRTHAGWMTTRQYMDHYYRDEYHHGLSQNPEFITLARALDTLIAHPEGFAPRDAAPVTWVGDQPHTFGGLRSAMTYILASADRGYSVIGSDVAGFLGDTIPPDVYIRWAQFSAFCGLFLNGGHGERALWRRTPEELELIRLYSWIHTELIPYIYSYVVTCSRGSLPLMRPVDGRFQYMFGDYLLVAPVYNASGTRSITLPTGRWRHWFRPEERHQGPVTFTRIFEMHDYPVYVREGAIIPLHVSRDYSGFGTHESEGCVTYAVYPGQDTSFDLYHPDDDVIPANRQPMTRINLTHFDSAFSLKLEGEPRRHILRVFTESKPVIVSLDDQHLPEGERWRYEEDNCLLWVYTDEDMTGEYHIYLSHQADNVR